jgi:hypothetical protein
LLSLKFRIINKKAAGAANIEEKAPRIIPTVKTAAKLLTALPAKIHNETDENKTVNVVFIVLLKVSFTAMLTDLTISS